jgi:hypothetical protein
MTVVEKDGMDGVMPMWWVAVIAGMGGGTAAVNEGDDETQ